MTKWRIVAAFVSIVLPVVLRALADGRLTASEVQECADAVMQFVLRLADQGSAPKP